MPRNFIQQEPLFEVGLSVTVWLTSENPRLKKRLTMIWISSIVDIVAEWFCYILHTQECSHV